MAAQREDWKQRHEAAGNFTWLLRKAQQKIPRSSSSAPELDFKSTRHEGFRKALLDGQRSTAFVDFAEAGLRKKCGLTFPGSVGRREERRLQLGADVANQDQSSTLQLATWPCS